MRESYNHLSFIPDPQCLFDPFHHTWVCRMVLQSLTSWLHELVFFGGNVQTTALAMAILGSLCFSLVWLFVSLINNPGEHESLLTLLSRRKQQKKNRRQLSPNSPAHRRASLVRCLNPLRAKFFRGNVKIYLHFVSFLHISMIQVIEILPQVR